MLDPALVGRPPIDDFYLHAIARDGMLIGAWRRDREGSEVVVRTDLHVPLDLEETAALESAAAEYGQFVGTPVRVTPRER
jgi:hypothetical protein